MRGAFSILPLFLTAVLLAGCLPGQRTTPRELFPADSLSRQIAQTVPVDTLEVLWRQDLPGEVRYPMTMAWAGERIFVADAQQATIHEFDGRGAHRQAFHDENFQYPLLAGVAGDTIAVLSRGMGHVVLMEMNGPQGGRVMETIPIPAGRNPVAALHRDGLIVKVADQDEGSRLYDIDFSGNVRVTHDLGDPFWRHIGFIRVWQDTIVSLSGYRPVVDVLALGAADGAAVDTLALRGFDSPQLARSRSFVAGDINEPPLLVPSAVAVDDRLFVLNARAGWAHVDIFRRAGDHLLLERSLLSPDLGLGRNFFAPDLAVQAIDDGFDIIVLENHPRPALIRYRWRPGPNGTAP